MDTAVLAVTVGGLGYIGYTIYQDWWGEPEPTPPTVDLNAEIQKVQTWIRDTIPAPPITPEEKKAEAQKLKSGLESIFNKDLFTKLNGGLLNLFPNAKTPTTINYDEPTPKPPTPPAPAPSVAPKPPSVHPNPPQRVKPAAKPNAFDSLWSAFKF